jgi:hypothetical protein
MKTEAYPSGSPSLFLIVPLIPCARLVEKDSVQKMLRRGINKEKTRRLGFMSIKSMIKHRDKTIERIRINKVLR